MRRYGGLMIQKITKIICDNCHQGIYDVIGNPPKRYEEFAKFHHWIVKRTDEGRKDFCNEKCYKEWKEKR